MTTTGRQFTGMARLVKVGRSDDFQYERRQIPLVVDETLTMVVQFDENCVDCDHVCGIKQKDLEKFVQKFNILSKDEIAVAMMVTSKDILNLLAYMVPCVGCRRSVERLYSQLVKSQHPALEPLVLTPNAVLSIKHHYLFDPRSLYALFYIHGARLNSVMEAIPKSKKNKRCNLHSLETHKTRITGGWIDIWNLLSQECREEVVLIDAENLLDTLETYLRKHRFCSECKSKVVRAYSILVGDLDSSKEKGYCPALYKGLRCCPQKQHLHVLCDVDFIAHLIGRAEPELSGGSRRDRHAKTLDVAQEEVLTCLGIHIYERLNRICQKLRAEEQTWQILFYLGVDALKKSFEVAVEMKQGVSNLELMCEELLEEERVKEQRREQKRQKRKKKKAKLQVTEKENTILEDVHCNCDTMEINGVKCLNCNPCDLCPDQNSNTNFISLESCDGCDLMHTGRKKYLQNGSRSSDCGYSSGTEGCENCSIPSSHNGSDIVCSNGVCSGHDGPDSICNSLQDDLDSCHSCLSSNSSPRHCTNHNPRNLGDENRAVSGKRNCQDSNQGQHLSLQDMLEASCSSEEEGGISEEEIRHFKANEKKVQRKRLELREMLKQRFHNFQRSTKSCKVLDCVTKELCNL